MNISTFVEKLMKRFPHEDFYLGILEEKKPSAID